MEAKESENFSDNLPFRQPSPVAYPVLYRAGMGAEQLQLVNHEVKQAAGTTASFSSQLLTIFNKKDNMLDMAHMDTGITGTVSGIIRSGQKSGEFFQKHNSDVITAALIASWIVLPLAKESPGFPGNAHEEVLNLLLGSLTAAQ